MKSAKLYDVTKAIPPKTLFGILCGVALNAGKELVYVRFNSQTQRTNSRAIY